MILDTDECEAKKILPGVKVTFSRCHEKQTIADLIIIIFQYK